MIILKYIWDDNYKLFVYDSGIRWHLCIFFEIQWLMKPYFQVAAIIADRNEPVQIEKIMEKSLRQL